MKTDIGYLGIILAVVLGHIGLWQAAADDVAGFATYELENQEIRNQPYDPGRVVFMGNSITYFWMRDRPEFFINNGFVCRGISGQSTYQFLLRFRQDVVSLHPALVVLNGGTNDVAENMYPFNIDRTFGNIVSMVEIAQANNIQVILASVLPAANFYWNPAVTDAPARIAELNGMIKEYAALNDIPYVDYYPELVSGSARALNPNFTEDGVHPNGKGYEVMESLLYPVIRRYVEYDTTLPNRLFLRYNGGVSEQDIEFTMTSVGHFMAFTQLAAEDVLEIKDNNDMHYYVKDGEIVRGENPLEIAEDGIYRIELDFITGKASVSVVKSFSVYHSGTESKVAELEYQGDGQWGGTWQCNLGGTDGTPDGRYRFVMETEDETLVFGTPGADGEGDGADTQREENIPLKMKKVFPADPYAHTWMLAEYFDKTAVLVRVNLRGEFRHFINGIVTSVKVTRYDGEDEPLVTRMNGLLVSNADGVGIYGIDGRLNVILNRGAAVNLSRGTYLAVKDTRCQTIVVG